HRHDVGANARAADRAASGGGHHPLGRARADPLGAAAHLRRRGAGEPGVRGYGAADRLRPDDLAAVHRRADDGGADRGRAAGREARQGARDRHRLRLSDRRPRAVRPPHIQSRADSASGQAGSGESGGGERHERELAARGRLARLAEPGAVRRDPGRGRAGGDSAGVARAARRRGPARDSDRPARAATPRLGGPRRGGVSPARDRTGQLRAVRCRSRRLKIFSPLYDRVLSWAGHRHAERYLFAMSFAESSFFPVPPDVLLAPMTLARPERGWRFAFWTTVASVLGGMAGYVIGWLALDARSEE